MVAHQNEGETFNSEMLYANGFHSRRSHLRYSPGIELMGRIMICL